MCLFSLSIGYSLFSQRLNIEGTVDTKAQSTTFKILFDNVSTSSVVGYATGNSSLDSTNKNITFSCNFISNYDACEISFDIYNRGVINAKYTGYSIAVTNNGTTHSVSGNTYSDGIINLYLINNNDWVADSTVLHTNEYGNFKVRALLGDNSTLSEDEIYTVSINFNFEQAPKD